MPGYGKMGKIRKSIPRENQTAISGMQEYTVKTTHLSVCAFILSLLFNDNNSSKIRVNVEEKSCFQTALFSIVQLQ